MRLFPRTLVLAMFALTISLHSLASLRAEEPAAKPVDSKQIEKLVRQLNDDQADRRDEAEQSLVKLAPTGNADTCDLFLEALPLPVEGMPAEVQARLKRIRKQIETEQSSRALAVSRITLSARAMPLSEVFEKVYQQTGNRLKDHREEFGQQATAKRITVEIKDQPFWVALDKILDTAGMTTYPYSGDESLALINREEAALPRALGASYAGPFRIEAINISTRRNLRSFLEQDARVEMEIAWEPRLKPIALSQSAESLKFTADDGTPIALFGEREKYDVEVSPGSHVTELTIPLELPNRSMLSISSFKGNISALVPGRVVEFKFKDLKKQKSFSQTRGGVEVTLVGVRKNQELWEVHMRLKVASEETGLESHRGWVFQNLTYLLNKKGELIDNAGFETTMQSETEVGLAYFFDLPDEDLSEFTWVYRTPASIVRLPIEYELKDIPLP